jgi:hypothetical protein
MAISGLVVGIVAALTNSDQPSAYWTAMKIRVEGEEKIELSTICRQLKLLSSDGKKYETDCADTEGIFRIIQSIPSPKLNLSNFGWQKLVTRWFGKLKIRNWRRCG